MNNLAKKSSIWLGLTALAFLLGGAKVAPTAGDPADEAIASIRPEALRADMRFLSDDLLEGRGTGKRGHEIAARYVASEFEGMGLEPAGDSGTYFQSVPLRSVQPDETHTALEIARGGKKERLVFRHDYIARGDPGRNESVVEAPVVYVGFGVTAPEQGYDNYQGVDVKGKIVAFISGAPPSFESAVRAHYSSGESIRANAVAHGAVGILLLYDPVLDRLYSFKEMVRDLGFPDLRGLDQQGQPIDFHPELLGQAALSMEGVKKIFEGSGHTADEVFAAAKAGKPVSFALPVVAKIHGAAKHGDLHSPNVAGKLIGSDSSLRDEYVVYTAHLDHLGIGEPVQGDKIYNGALDNASGSAILLEAAKAFTKMQPRPRRSILFVLVTGEEAGLLGSDYFARYPTVPKDAIVANVNLDEDEMLWPLQDVVVFGAEHSSLEAVVEKAAARLHLSVSPDPMPEEVSFIRSDQYSFVKQGIPAVFPMAGFKSDDPKINPTAIFKNWEQTRYHQPQDDMEQPGLDFEQGAKFARFNLLVGYFVAQETERPTWNKNDFFGEHYGRK